MTTSISLDKQRQQAADNALANYDFGTDLMITQSDHWLTDPSKKNRLYCRLHAEDIQSKSVALVLAVDFANDHAAVIDSVAYDLSTGNIIGTSDQ